MIDDPVPTIVTVNDTVAGTVTRIPPESVPKVCKGCGTDVSVFWHPFTYGCDVYGRNGVPFYLCDKCMARMADLCNNDKPARAIPDPPYRIGDKFPLDQYTVTALRVAAASSAHEYEVRDNRDGTVITCYVPFDADERGRWLVQEEVANKRLKKEVKRLKKEVDTNGQPAPRTPPGEPTAP